MPEGYFRGFLSPGYGAYLWELSVQLFHALEEGVSEGPYPVLFSQSRALTLRRIFDVRVPERMLVPAAMPLMCRRYPPFLMY